MTAFKTIVDAVKANNNTVIDDHNTGGKELKLAGLGLLQIGDREHAVALLDKTVFCLNPVKMGEDGKPHLSTSSVGGNIEARVTPSLECALELFNAEAKDNAFSPQELTHWEIFEPVEHSVEVDACFDMLDKLAVIIWERKREQADALGDRQFKQAKRGMELAQLQVNVLRKRSVNLLLE